MAAAKSSRNRTRKAAYAALADKGSRNQEAIEQAKCPSCAGGREVQCGLCGGIGTVPAASLNRANTGGAPVARIKRSGNARKMARQRRAWERCAYLDEIGAHNYVDGNGRNCKCCGCPIEHAREQQAA